MKYLNSFLVIVLLLLIVSTQIVEALEIALIDAESNDNFAAEMCLTKWENECSAERPLVAT